MNIYVGNLHYSVDEDDLTGIFEDFGVVKSVKLIMDKFTGKSKGFGFVEMVESADAEKAIEACNDAELEGRTMRVNEARERTDKREFNTNNNRR